MDGNLNLGKYYGTKIEIHWTFFLIIAWIILTEVVSGGSIDRILFNLQFILAVILCVFLHEMGHAMAAKHFGIKTKKIVLLPIGGISTNDITTNSPKEEFLITAAGPIVNIIIAIILFFAVPVHDYISLNLGQYFTALSDFSFRTFFFFLFIVNVALVIFNMIPAFPLDGGRILRALLDLKFDRVRATKIAATIGNIIAMILLLIGFLFNPILIFMSLFLFIGSFSENRIVHELSLLKGHKVRDAMLEDITVFDPNDTMEAVIKVIISGSETNFIVVGDEKILGILYHKDIIENSNKRQMLVKNIMSKVHKTMQANEALSVAYRLMENEVHPFFPVVEKNKLVGAIDFANLNEFILMEDKLKS